MWSYNYTHELYHHGVKGMKWGVRKKYTNADGSLNDKGIKKYARKGYAQDAYNSNKTRAGKIYDRYTGAHKISGQMQYDMSSKKQNKARAEKYLRDKAAQKNAPNGQKLAKVAGKTAKVVGRAAVASLMDDMFFGGAGKKAVKATVKTAGRAAVSAVVRARGGYNIRWYDN